MKQTEEEFIREKVKVIDVCSCHVPPAAIIVEHDQMLTTLLLGKIEHGPVIIAGDSNARMAHTDNECHRAYSP